LLQLIAAIVLTAMLVLPLSAAADPLGVITEFPIGPPPNSGPDGITAGYEGDLWFTYGPSAIGRITPAGSVSVFPITMNGDPHAIAQGPDHNIWFTEPNGKRIGRITRKGKVTEFSAGIPVDSEPLGIAAGPDGNLWFTNPLSDRIGRITRKGKVIEFSKGITEGSEPWGITAGPDGDLWFTERNRHRIGRISPAGVVTEFSSDQGLGDPLEITVGSDGNLWFTEEGASRIGRITPSGSFTEFSNGITQFSHPRGISSGPDGDVWFAQANNAIGRITANGEVTEFSAGLTEIIGYNLNGITAGPDGNLWFTEGLGSQIGKIGAGPVSLVTKLSPKKGPEQGGTSVTITGAELTGATSVTFGSVAATSFVVTSAHSILAIAPPGAAGAVDLTITTPLGTSPVSPKDRYKYVR
jgi:streptogramin lyase